MKNEARTETAMKALLERKLENMFPDDFMRRRVGKTLQDYGATTREREPARVRLAILKLAGAELQSVEKYTRYACEDYRTILAWAEYPRQTRLWVRPDPEEKQKLVEADLTEYENWLHEG
jgi:hypothetical protein